MDTVASVPEDGEKIIEIQLERLRTFKNHPFKIRMDQEMIRLRASSDIYSSCLLHKVQSYGNYTSYSQSPGTQETALFPGLSLLFGYHCLFYFI